MSVNRAYISSLWTTGILVASSIFVLAFTSALVTFHHWPEAAPGARIDRVTVSPPAPAVQKVIARPRVAPRHTTTAAPGRAAAAPARPAPRAPAPVEPPVKQPTTTAPNGTAPGTSTSTTSTPTTSTSSPQQQPTAPKSNPTPGDVLRDTGATLGSDVAPTSSDGAMLIESTSDQGGYVVDTGYGTAAPPVL